MTAAIVPASDRRLRVNAAAYARRATPGAWSLSIEKKLAL
jgi:hypothetical protein